MRIPLWVEVEGRRVTVFGGGNVGTRRALMFRDAGATVRVVGLYFSKELKERAKFDNGIILVEADARNRDVVRENVEWADIVVIATSDDEVNKTVWETAKALGKWVNDATNAMRTDIVVPYTLEILDGAVKIAVTSEGKSGVVARRTRDIIRECLRRRNDIAILYEVMWRVKPVLKQLIPDGRQRFPVYFEVEKVVADKIGVSDVNTLLEEAAKVIARAVERSTGKKVAISIIVDMLHRVREPIKPLAEQGESVV